MFSSFAHAFASDRRGTVALEFGIVGLIFITLLLGAVELSRYQIVQQSLRSVAEDGARAAILLAASGGCPTGAAVEAAVMTPVNPTPMLSPANLVLATNGCPVVSGVNSVTVTATYPFAFVVPLFTVGPNLTASATLSYQ